MFLHTKISHSVYFFILTAHTLAYCYYGLSEWLFFSSHLHHNHKQNRKYFSLNCPSDTIIAQLLEVVVEMASVCLVRAWIYNWIQMQAWAKIYSRLAIANVASGSSLWHQCCPRERQVQIKLGTSDIKKNLPYTRGACRTLLKIQYVIAIDLMRWLTNFYDFSFKWTATAAIGIHPTKAWLSQLVNFKDAISTWGHFRRTICNKILF